jgi:hypothetical protein
MQEITICDITPLLVIDLLQLVIGVSRESVGLCHVLGHQLRHSLSQGGELYNSANNRHSKS